MNPSTLTQKIALAASRIDGVSLPPAKLAELAASFSVYGITLNSKEFEFRIVYDSLRKMIVGAAIPDGTAIVHEPFPTQTSASCAANQAGFLRSIIQTRLRPMEIYDLIERFGNVVRKNNTKKFADGMTLAEAGLTTIPGVIEVDGWNPLKGIPLGYFCVRDGPHYLGYMYLGHATVYKFDSRNSQVRRYKLKDMTVLARSIIAYMPWRVIQLYHGVTDMNIGFYLQSLKLKHVMRGLRKTPSVAVDSIPEFAVRTFIKNGLLVRTGDRLRLPSS